MARGIPSEGYSCEPSSPDSSNCWDVSMGALGRGPQYPPQESNSRTGTRVRQVRHMGPKLESLTLKIIQAQIWRLPYPSPGLSNAHGNLISGNGKNFRLIRIKFPVTMESASFWNWWNVGQHNSRISPFYFSAGDREGWTLGDGVTCNYC